MNDLHSRQFFIHRREHNGISYQYHALFREFLLSKLAEQYNQSNYVELIRHTAHVLVKHEQEEEAVSLYLQHCDWEIAIPLVLSRAPKLIALGRAQLLAGWLGRIPDPWLNSTPWLLYWKGISQMVFNPFIAQELLQSAFIAFDAEKSSIGKVLSASAIMDINYLLRKSLLSAAPWIDAIQKELALKPQFPSPEVETRVLTSLLSLLTYLRPQEDNLPLYADRLSELLTYDLSANQKVHATTYLVHYYSMIEGNLRICERLILSVQQLLQSQEVTALNQILWRILSSPYHTLRNNREKAYGTVTPLTPLIREHNLKFIERLADIYIVTVYHNFRDFDKAMRLLQHAEGLVINLHPADIAWLNLGKSISALGYDNYTAALEFGTMALRLTESLGAVLILVEIHCLLGLINCELAKYGEASRHLDTAKVSAFAGSPRLKREAYQVEAYIYLRTGQLEKCHAVLREAFFIANKHGLFGGWLCWSQRMMSCLCTVAVKNDIEPEYVKRLIYERGLSSDDPTLDAWPWPIKVYCLGGFDLSADNQKSALTFNEVKGQQQKLLVMLKTIIASGGKDIRIDHICEILWPEAEGDAAASAFTTTLARLRKLIGPETLQISNGRISIDTRRCWVDALALDLYIENIKSIGNDDSTIETLEIIAQLYRGPFLMGEDGDWVQAYRERLRKKLSQVIRQCTDASIQDSYKGQYLLDQIQISDNKLHFSRPN